MHWIILILLFSFVLAELIGDIELNGYLNLVAALAIVCVIIQLIQGRKPLK